MYNNFIIRLLFLFLYIIINVVMPQFEFTSKTPHQIA